METVRLNIRECSVRLWRCDLDRRRSIPRAECGVPVVPLEPAAPITSHASDCNQGYAAMPVMIIKTEHDAEDAYTSQEAGAGLAHIPEAGVTDVGWFIKEEHNFIMKTEGEVDEVRIKQELEIGPTVLQPRAAQCAPSPLTRAGPHPRPNTSTGVGGTPAPPCTSESATRHQVSFPPSPKIEAQDDHCEKGSMTRADADCRRALSERSDDCTGGEDTAEDRPEGGQQYKCHYCKYNTTRKSHLINHISRHVCEKLYKCKQCRYRAPYPSYLRTHMRSHTGEKPYACGQCEFRASRTGNLKEHMRTHTGEKPYACEQCKYRTAQLSNIKKHMRTHTVEKPYTCEQCEYRTSHLGHLKRHMRIHTGEKPYACEQCEFRASRPDHLKEHMRTHTGEKRYACGQCEFRACRPGYLKKHMRTHTGEKPYACEQCEYRASQLGDIKKHMRTHTCEQSKYRTSYLGRLKRHMRTHTGEKTLCMWAV